MLSWKSKTMSDIDGLQFTQAYTLERQQDKIEAFNSVANIFLEEVNSYQNEE